MKNKNINRLTLLLFTPLVLASCGKEEERKVIPIPEIESSEEIDMEQFRVEGDRVKEPPVLGTEEQQKRLIKQYETIDRPVMVNTLRYINEFDKKHEGAFKGVRLITGKSIDTVKEKMAKEYIEQLGEPLHKDTVKVYDISKVYPYTEDDFLSYYDTVIGILKEEVVERTQTYESIKTGIEKQEFDRIKGSGVVRNLQSLIESGGGLSEQLKPYIEEMDKLVADMRVNVGMDLPKYTKIDGDIEDVAEYVVPKKKTVQEVIETTPSSELYEDKEDDKDQKQESKDSTDTSENDTGTGDDNDTSESNKE